MSVQRQLSQRGRGQRVSKRHETQGSGAQAPRHVNDLGEADGIRQGLAGDGQAESAGIGGRDRGSARWDCRGRRTTAKPRRYPVPPDNHRSLGPGEALSVSPFLSSSVAL